MSIGAAFRADSSAGQMRLTLSTGNRVNADNRNAKPFFCMTDELGFG